MAWFKVAKVSTGAPVLFAQCWKGSIRCDTFSQNSPMGFAWSAKGTALAGHRQHFDNLYYISDKDRDGITDLYCEHLNVANPVAMYISDLQGTEVEPGLWKIYLKASFGQATAVWETHIRQRTN